jgi:hypothetical protein
MTVTSGRRCTALLENQSPLGLLRKTLLESSRWNSTTCFLTWKVKATPSNRLLFQLAPSMPDTDETEFGLWATPHTPNGGRVNSAEEILNKGTTDNGKRQVSLESQVKMWPTPHGMSKDGKSNGPSGNELGFAVNSANGQTKENGSLNPTWVEWLMGYPIGFTALKDWATRLSRRSRMKF